MRLIEEQGEKVQKELRLIEEQEEKVRRELRMIQKDLKERRKLLESEEEKIKIIPGQPPSRAILYGELKMSYQEKKSYKLTCPECGISIIGRQAKRHWECKHPHVDLGELNIFNWVVTDSRGEKKVKKAKKCYPKNWRETSPHLGP